jgi:dienelactone hydrolase
MTSLVGAYARALALASALVACHGNGGGGGTAGSARTTHDLVLKTAAVNGTAAAPIHADLYLPSADERQRAPDGAKGALVVFVEANDAMTELPAADAGAPLPAFGGDVGDALERRGIATLALAVRLAKDYSLRMAAADVAAAAAEVLSMPAMTASRFVFVGRGAGASIAALLALDKSLSATVGRRIDGVVAMRGTYDLSPPALEDHPQRALFAAIAGHAGEEGKSSPSAFVRGDAPPFLLLAGSDDDGTFPRLMRTFAGALERAGGAVESYLAPYHDQHNLTQLAPAGAPEDDLGELVVSFVARGLHPLAADTTYGIRQRWSKKPPLDDDAFRADPKAIATYPVDAEFIRNVGIPLGKARSELNVLPGRTYQAIDLRDWLATRPESEIGHGDWLVVSNLRDERFYLSRSDLETYRPVIVVGMDDETNLFRLFTHYRLKQAYSWKKGEEPMPPMIRPIGAFLYFRKPLPDGTVARHLRNKSFMPFGLGPKSFHWVESDPLAPVRSLPDPLRDTLAGEQGCLKCHSFRGAGAKAHHTLAADGKPYGAFALSFEEYPTEVLRRFLFEQDAVAKSFDVAPLHVDPTIAKSLFELVTRKESAPAPAPAPSASDAPRR